MTVTESDTRGDVMKMQLKDQFGIDIVYHIMCEGEGVLCGVHVDNYRELLEKAEELARLVKGE